MTKQLLKFSMSGVDKRTIATIAIAEKILLEMKHHIGSKNSISRSALFKSIFKKPYHDDNLADYVRWEFARKAMHYIRKHTHCFIICVYQDWAMEHVYCVADSIEDARHYEDRLDKSIKAMQYMKKRCHQSVLEHWSKESWTLPKSSRIETLK